MSADTDMVELEACPFCGREARVGRVGRMRQGICYHCEAAGPLCETDAGAIHAWNTRAALDASGIGEMERENARLWELLDEAFDLLGGVDDASELRGKILGVTCPAALRGDQEQGDRS